MCGQQVILEEKVVGDVCSQDIQVYCICAIFSPTLRFVCSIQHVWLCRPTRPGGCSTLSRDDLMVGQILLLISLTSREENVLKAGRVEETKVEK